MIAPTCSGQILSYCAKMGAYRWVLQINLDFFWKQGEIPGGQELVTWIFSDSNDAGIIFGFKSVSETSQSVEGYSWLWLNNINGRSG